MAERNPNEQVYMKHPNVESIGGPVPFHTYRTVWQNKGWSEIAPHLVAASAVLERDVTDLNKLNSDDLAIVARNAGFDPDQVKAKGDLVSLIEGTPSSPAAPGSTPGGEG